MDFDLDKYLDNVIQGKSNEELMQLENKRQPASVQKENVVSISDSVVRPIDVGSNYKFKIPESKIILDNSNRAIEQRQADAQGLGQNYQEISKDLGENKNQIQDLISKTDQVSANKYKESPELTGRINKAYDDLDSAKVPERDMLSQAILSFGPALFGSLTGESGAISQLKGGENARNIYENYRKEDISNAKTKNESYLKRYNDLVKLRDSGSDKFTKDKQLELDAIRTKFSAVNAITSLNSKDLDKTQSMINEIGKETSTDIQKGSENVAKMEDSIRADKEREKRASIIGTGQGLKDATNLRKEFLGLDQVKNFKDVQSSYEKITDLAKKNSPAGDMSLIFAYMKMLDPGSVVREGEQAQAAQARGVPDAVLSAYNRAVSGEKLTNAQRKDFQTRAADIFNSQQGIVANVEKDYEGLAKSYGTDPKLIVPTKSKPIQTEPIYKDGDKHDINGKIYIRRNGQWSPQ